MYDLEYGKTQGLVQRFLNLKMSSLSQSPQSTCRGVLYQMNKCKEKNCEINNGTSWYSVKIIKN